MAPPAQPLRLGIIGLSATATTSWASNAHLPGLLTARGKSLYTIAALCNSSVSAAEAAIKTYALPSTTKAYGSPQDLADDPEIDAVICSVRVDKHFETILPAVKKGKIVYVEWPIAANAEEVNELVAAAKISGAKVAVGIQGRWVPAIQKVREIVQSGRLGKVLSSDVSAYGGLNSRNSLPPGLDYFAEKKVGGNVIVIGFGHMLDFTLSALGDFVKGTTSARTQIQFKENDVVDPKTRKTVNRIPTNVPDLITVHGQLNSESGHLVPDATMSIKFRRGQPFHGEPALTWRIYCEKGEIRLTSFGGMSPQASAPNPPPEIQIQHFADDAVKSIPWEWSKEQLEVPAPARGVMSCLYALAEGNEHGWVSLEDAAVRAEQIEAWLNSGEW